MSEDKLKWVDKVLDHFIEDVGGESTDHDEREIQRKIILLVQYRANGLDVRKMGLLAADVYRLVLATRKRVIEDMAKVAATMK